MIILFSVLFGVALGMIIGAAALILAGRLLQALSAERELAEIECKRERKRGKK